MKKKRKLWAGLISRRLWNKSLRTPAVALAAVLSSAINYGRLYSCDENCSCQHTIPCVGIAAIKAFKLPRQTS